MGKFYSIAGLAPWRRSDKARELPDIHEHEATREWAESRGATSHGVLGLDQGMQVDFRHRGETKHGTVLAEVPDKQGNVDLYVRTEGNRGGDTYVTHWEPHTAREMVQSSEPKKVRRAPS